MSHMGRFVVTGPDAVDFLCYALTNDAGMLSPGWSQYTMIPDESGHAVDDAYLYRWSEDEYMLVVNAANVDKDWSHLQNLLSGFDARLRNVSEETAMIAIQGPRAEHAMLEVLKRPMPAAKRNALATNTWRGSPVTIGRTGYTGEPVGFELIVPSQIALPLWEELVSCGMRPVGLGARDTLRLEAGLPLYGHELGTGPDGQQIPIFACPLAKFAVKLSADRPDFLGRAALERQATLQGKDKPDGNKIPRILSFVLTGRGVARAGSEVWKANNRVGWVTSGTMVPYWIDPVSEHPSCQADTGMRALGMALLDADISVGDALEFAVRGKRIPGLTVARNLRSNVPPFAIPVLPTSSAS